MAISYDNTPLDWKNEGVIPPSDVQTNGFKAGDKPPAAYFNYQWHIIGKCLKELQEKLSAENTARNGITRESLGLDKVNNTADSEKKVAFASEAGVGRKVQNSMTVRINGGDTEGTDKWTFDGSTSRSINLTPEKLGAATENLSNVDPAMIDGKLKAYGSDFNKISQAFSPDGISYEANIFGIKSLYDGLEVILTPLITSASTTITLNVNNLGAKPVRLQYNFNTSALATPELPTFFGENRPVKFRYNESAEVMISGQKVQGVWVVADKEIVSASYLTGITPVEHGGTGIQGESVAELANQLNEHLIVEATSTDGVSYTATIEGITELHDGMTITIKPNIANTASAVTLNLNGTGAINIRRPLSFSTYVANSPEIGFIHADTPCRLMYHAEYANKGTWLMVDKVKYSANDLYGSLHSSVTTTLKASDWNGNEYSFEDDYPADEYDIDLSLNGDSLTKEQKEAYSDAEIIGCSSSNKIKAFGTVPTINIPIIIKAVKK